jgi:molecular chaperone GrpE
MSDTPPPPDADGPAGRGPLTPAAIDAVLADFRAWLEALAANPPPPTDPEPPAVDLATLVGAFTALRHEVNLQTKATRAQAELVERAMASVAAPRAAPPTGEDVLRPLLDTLVELHDALLLAERELTAARDALPDREVKPPRVPTWTERLFSFAWQRKRRRNKPGLAPTAAEASRQRLTAAVTGLQMTLRRVERALAKHDLEPIAAAGQPFDPEAMEVLEAVPADGRSAGEVVEEVRRGYRWRGHVFRYAQVRVAK